MDLEELAQLVSVLQNGLTALAIIVGGTWAILRFYREREAVPRLQWELEVKRIGTVGATALLEIVAIIENKGKIRHEIRSFSAGVSLLDGAEIATLPAPDAYEPAFTSFSVSLMPKASDYTFIEPGVKARYCELVVVPASAAAIYVYARFDYGRGTEYDENEYTLSLTDTSRPLSVAVKPIS